MYKEALAIALFGSIGVVTRYLLVSRFNQPHHSIPWGTLGVNLVGSFLLGVILGLLSRHIDWPIWFSRAILIGFLGGFTTFSAFSGELMVMLQEGRWSWAVAYSLISAIGGVGLCFLGLGLVTKSGVV